MALLTENPPTVWAPDGGNVPDVRPPRRRVRGLTFPAVPSWALTAQLAGALAAEVGVWQEFGRPVALMVGGAAAVLVGMLREAGKI